MRRRLFRFQWSLRSLLLLTAAVAVWVDYFKIRREIPRLETRVVSMQEMIGELIAEDPGHGSSGGNEVGRCVQLPRDKAVVLFRRRFSHRQPDGSSTTPAGPREGLLLWIEAISGVRD